MGRASSNKKVARAARAGGAVSRRRGSGSYGFPTTLGIIVVVGVALIAFSRTEGRASASVRPRVNHDHWHAAYGFDICGTFAPSIPQFETPDGIHTHGDGVIHIHPFTASASGKNATLGFYLAAAKAKATPTEVQLPGNGGLHKRNGDKCGDKPGVVEVMTWSKGQPVSAGKRWLGKPASLRLRDNQLITIAFLPKDQPIPQPPSASTLDHLNDVAQPTPTTIPVSPVTSAAPVPPSSAPEPTAPPSSAVPSSPAP